MDDLLQTADISFPKQFTFQSRLFDIIFLASFQAVRFQCINTFRADAFN